MLRVVGEVVAGFGMGEDGETAAVEREPLRDIAKVVALNCQLAAAARVRSHGAEVEMADGDRETGLRGGGKRPRLLDLLGIVIDVRVEIADRWFAHALSYSAPHRPFAGADRAL